MKNRKIISLPISRTPRYLALGTAVVHVLVALSHGGPVAVPDVSAYLSVSQWIHGGVLPGNLAYHPGYGMLLAPFGGLSGGSLHTSALLANAALAGACVLMASRLMERHGGPTWAVQLAGVLAAFHPSHSTASRVAWPETLLVAVLLGLALLVDQDRWVLAGVLSVLSVALHPRSVVILGAVIIVAVLERRLRRMLCGATPALVGTIILLQLTGSWQSARIDAAQSIGDGPGPLATISGQWLALGAGTGGLALIGLVIAVKTLTKRSWPPSGAVLAVSVIGMFVLGGWVLAGSARMDTILYGRYVGPWAVPLAIVGLASVCRGAISRRAAAMLSICSLVAALLAIAASSQVTETSRQIMTLSLGVLWDVFDDNVTWVVVVAVTTIVLGVVSSQRSPLLPLMLFGLIAIPSLVLNHEHLHHVGQIADGQATTAELIPADIACLAHDSSAKSYSMWLYRLELPHMEHQRVNLAKGERPCGMYVVAEMSVLDDCVGATLVQIEPRANWGMWKYPDTPCS